MDFLHNQFIVPWFCRREERFRNLFYFCQTINLKSSPKMSPEPTSVAALSHKRTNTSSSSYLTTLLNNNSTTSETRENQDFRHIQRQRSLNGNHNMNNLQSQLHSTLSSNHDRLSAEMHSSLDNGSLDLLVAAAAALKLENSSTGRLEQKRLEQKRLEYEHQRYEQRLFETKMKMLELRQLKEQDLLENHQSQSQRSNTSSQSVPNSRRNSNESPEAPSYPGGERLNKKDKISENIKKEFIHTSVGLQSSSSQHRDTTLTSESNNDNAAFPQFNGNFLLDEEVTDPSTSSSSYVCRYLQMNADDDLFPVLIRRDSYPGMLSACSAALDLAPLPQSTSRHRCLDSFALYQKSGEADNCQLSQNRDQLGPLLSESQASNKKMIPTSTVSTNISANNLGNVSSGMSYSSDRKKLDNLNIDDNVLKSQRVPKLSSSYSTPNLASATRLLGCRSTNFNANTANDILLEMDNQINHSVQLPNVSTAGDITGQANMNVSPQIVGFQGVAYYGQYGNMLQSATGYNYNQNLANLNSMRLVHPNNILSVSKMNQKRMSGDLEVNRFAGIMLEDLVGEIYSFCKDQHGCRYLQKKLEEKNEQYIGMIFNEVFSHFVELMTDPFGNYLCQKLLEYCNDDQRTIIIETVAPELVNISLNMHGTRAVQKMIEFLSTPQQFHSNGYVIKKQIRMVIAALNPNVVTLIKDLNGNHVIQKCLNRLSSEDNQFIYNIISKNCIEVATHRHGCCVLQRCIDHASETQKIQLVTEITYNALTLVQDPFGNYVVQYVLDLGDNRFTDSLIRKFIGNVCLLSVQKFSSNVMEKCIRVAEPETRKFLIDEMLNWNQLDKLLRDSYANYVVQTSLDYADPIQRAQLIECLRPLLPAIRNTPYGKRIQGKLHREQQQQMQALSSLNMLGLPLHGLSNLGNFTGNFSSNMSGGIIGMNDYTTPSFRYI
ncbi:ARM repeat-containing protein [Rhizophagus clarus]|uniref:ARM repeat-containing protein n=1 Tax=Rhizophagus clarus TaxID=94130 RepID=A0A8H3LQQ7_9GLOM|nr:ARM repeat-containing protein [Rhizophagus clarus]